MWQKRNLLKGQQRKKSIPPSCHGETSRTRKGTRVVKPSKETKEMDADAESSKFINNCNEEKAATAAIEDGGESSIIKSQPDSASGAK
ncbi:hypothetical protein DH2020_025841 [Rehmannia glutinosa]|uniref:Uncharacterized protein n=1 Tax=Rehmannia glutinosa TaxID=99300 RepID=A0ABR0W258_REHGL